MICLKTELLFSDKRCVVLQADYRRAIDELDEKQFISLQLVCCELRNNYVSTSNIYVCFIVGKMASVTEKHKYLCLILSIKLQH